MPFEEALARQDAGPPPARRGKSLSQGRSAAWARGPSDTATAALAENGVGRPSVDRVYLLDGVFARSLHKIEGNNSDKN
jgi:hypothetical protein